MIYKVTLSFTEELLGTAPLSEQLYSQYIASKAPASMNGESLAAELDLVEEKPGVKGMTGFRRNDEGRPVYLDYMVKGFLKEAWQARRQNPDNLSAAFKAGKSKIDSQVFVAPRLIPLLNWSKSIEYVYERPLRAETMQGPRVALASSECLPAGMKMAFEVEVLAPKIIPQELLEEWFSYGRYCGMGQWRSGGFGRFGYQITARA